MMINTNEHQYVLMGWGKKRGEGERRYSLHWNIVHLRRDTPFHLRFAAQQTASHKVNRFSDDDMRKGKRGRVSSFEERNHN